MSEILNTETTIVDRNKATQLLSYTFHGQRQTAPNRVEIYAMEMLTDRWYTSEGPIIVAVVHGKNYLIAGKHRMEAVLKAAELKPDIGVLMEIQYRKYDSDKEVMQDYAVTNTGKAFTRHQAFRAMGTHEIIGVQQQTVAAASAAIRLIATNFEGTGAGALKMGIHSLFNTNEFLHEAILHWRNPIYAYEGAVSHAFGRQITWYRRAAVMAVGLVTFRFQPEKAEEFWRTTALGSGLKIGDPQFAFRNFLSTTTVPSSPMLLDYIYRVTRPWNAFYEEREIIKIAGPRGGNELNTAVILGTPWNGIRRVDVLELFGISGKNGK